MNSLLWAGIILGVTAGLSPGPLLALVISETLTCGLKGGVKVSLAPLVSDVPIALLAVGVLSRLSGVSTVLGVISVIGAAFVLMLGVQNLLHKETELSAPSRQSRALLKGIAVNSLSPHPYLFWFAVGGPIVITAFESSPPESAAFILVFYTLLVGSKIAVAVLVSKYRVFLRGNVYRTIVRILGGVLMLFALRLFFDGLKMF